MAITYEPIATATGLASTITFSSIPSTYTDLKLVIVARVNNAPDSFYIRLNNDTATNYSANSIAGNGSSASAGTNVTLNRMNVNATAINSAQTIFGLYEFNFFSYAGSTNKTVLISASNDLNGAGMVGSTVGMWRNTNAITSISFSSLNMGTDNTTIYYTATLYGIKAA